jgi:hypothetical protein
MEHRLPFLHDAVDDTFGHGKVLDDRANLVDGGNVALVDELFDFIAQIFLLF